MNPNDPNNPYFFSQNSGNLPEFYPNPNDFQVQNQVSNQPPPQNVPHFYYQPSAMPSAVPAWNPYFAMQFQRPPPPSRRNLNLNMPGTNEYFENSQASEFPEYSTQMAMSGGEEATPTPDSATGKKKIVIKWSTADNLVLISGWIKFGTNSAVGKNQKFEAFWGKIVDYCNKFCSFDEPLCLAQCKNRHNYINARVSKWIGAYDNAKRAKESGWSEDDVLAKAHQFYISCGLGRFNLMEEWKAIRDQPRYASLVGGNTGSDSSGTKRSHDESDASDSNSVGTIPRPMGRDAAKKKGKKKVGLSPIKEQKWLEFKKYKDKEFEHYENIATQQEKSNIIALDSNRTQKMNLWMNLSEKEYRDDQQQKLFEILTAELFNN